MDDIISIILICSIFSIIGIFIFYLVKIYFAPKKLEQIADMIKLRQITPAIKRLVSYIEEHERDIYAHFLLAEAYRIQERKSDAILEYKKIIRLGTFDNQVREEVVRSRLANLLFDIKSLDDAKKEFLILTKLDPTNADNYYKVALLFKTAGIHDKAINYFQQCVRINPGHAKAHLEQGILLFLISNIPDAKHALVQAVKLDSSLSEAHYYLGNCLKQQKEFDWAIKEYDIAMQDRNLKGRCHMGKGMCMIDADNHTHAMLEFEKGLEFAQKGSEVEFNLKYLIASCAEIKRDLYTAIRYWEDIHSVNARFKDVAQKLKNYEDLRTEDSVKDFLIANAVRFEQICKLIIESMNFKIVDFNIVNDTELHAMVTDSDFRWKNTKVSNYLVYIFRVTEPISEQHLRKMYEDMKAHNATKGYCFTTSSFNPQAEIFSQTRPVELIDKTALISYLKKVAS